VLPCSFNQSCLLCPVGVFHRFTAFTKKEKRSKKERKLLLRLDIQIAAIAALNTYKGQREAGAPGPPSPSRRPGSAFHQFSPLPRIAALGIWGRVG
jgi:hypothetical protein